MAAPTVKTRQTEMADEVEVRFESSGMTVVVACFMHPSDDRLVLEVRDPKIRAVVLYNGYCCYPLFPREVWEREASGPSR